MRFPSRAFWLSVLLVPGVCSAADLKQSRFTQVINDVKVIEMPTRQTKPAAVNELFKAPDVIRTGPGSRAELVAEDRTITRIGANSIFSFDPANRTISLEKGSLLFQSPKGKGGGTIRTTSAAASVLGTTMIVAATEDGGFKVLLLEGKGKVTLPNGKSVILKPGQMVFVLPNGQGFSPIINFRLAEQVEGSLLVNGFKDELPSMDLIDLEITRQNKLIANGKAVDTGLLVGNRATGEGVEVIDPNLLQQVFNQSNPNDPYNPGPGPDPDPENPPPTTLIFDLIIGSKILDNDDLHYGGEVGYYMKGINVLVDAMTVDMSVAAGDPSFYIEAYNIMQFNDNASHSTMFLGGRSVQYAGGGYLDSVTGWGIVDYLHLAAGDFVFPEEFSLSFDGYQFVLSDANDMTLSSSSPNGLRFETLGAESSFRMEAAGNLDISGNVHFYAGLVDLSAGNDFRMKGGYLGGQYMNTITAGNEARLRDVQFFGGYSTTISIYAKTIVLEDIIFPYESYVYLQSELGQLAPNPNTGAQVMPGMVNFVRNVYYGSTSNPAQNVIDDRIIIGRSNY